MRKLSFVGRVLFCLFFLTPAIFLQSHCNVTTLYNVGGTVSGLNGTLLLQNNGGDDLTLTADGSFTFTTALAEGSTYAVTVFTQPSGQTCSIVNGTGTLSSANVTNVTVTCSSTSNTYTVGGEVSGLSGTLVLQNNGGDDLTLTADGSFTFTTALAEGSTYAVTVLTQPVEQTCVVTNGSGTGSDDITNVEVTCSADDAVISVTGSPLLLNANGSTGTLTITNDSATVTALGIASNFAGSALDGNVIETGNTCSTLLPGASCTLTYTPGNTVVTQTEFSIQGTNTNLLSPAIEIEDSVSLVSINPNSGSASGETSFTLTGTGLSGTTSVTFDGVAATSVNIVNSTTVTGVTPAHAVGAVDVVINTPGGSATLSSGFTYVATALGQSTGGGIVGCLGGGLNNMIALAFDISASAEWGGFGSTTSAQSDTDGATNTATIVSVLGNNGGTPYAAQLCNDFEMDSQGNVPCEVGNTCYDDWFLPAKDQLSCIRSNQGFIGGFTGNYSTSTESSVSAASDAWAQNFGTGTQALSPKSDLIQYRCVRNFTP